MIMNALKSCGRATHRYSCGALERLLRQQRAYELVPLLHPGTLLTHVIPAIVTLRAHVLQRVVLDPVSNFFRNARLSGKGLPRPTQIAVCDDRDDAAMSLPPHEAVERAVTERTARILRRGKEPAVCVGLDGFHQFGRERWNGDRVRHAVLGLGPIDNTFSGIPMIDVETGDLLHAVGG